MHLHDGIDNQERRIAVVTLHVQEVQVGSTVDIGLQVLILVALPSIDAEF